MVERIVVGIDFSEASRAALVQGAHWARGLGIPLNAMHVLSAPPALLSVPADARELEARALDRLREWTEPYPHAVPEVRWGSPAQCLVEAARAGVLLMIGQGGQPSFPRLFFGSTAERVVRRVPRAVLVIRAGGPVSLRKETP